MFRRIWQSISEVFTIDLRSLSIMRIGIGVILIADLLIRLSNLEAHYTNGGVLPLEPLFRFAWSEYYFSFFTISGNYFIQFLLFSINILLAISFLVGFRTKLSTILCWLFLISIHNRNPLIHQGGDDLLRLILFWGIFLPWGSYFSLDSYRAEKRIESTSVSSFAVFGYLLQIAYVYFFSALLKNSPEWTSDYSALYYALSFDQIVLPFGKLIYPYYGILQVLTAMVFYIELMAPLLLIIPVKVKLLRTVFFVLIFSLHLGIAFCLNVGLFPYIGIISMIGMLPFEVIQSVGERLKVVKMSVFNPVVLWLDKFLPDQKSTFHFEERSLSRIFLILVSVYILNWNLFTIQKELFYPNSELKWFGAMLRVDQHWGMFAPSVFKDDGWFVLAGKSESGKEYDLLTSSNSINYKRASGAIGVFKEDRWRKYSENILFVHNSHFRNYYCYYLIHHWNRHHSPDAKISSLEIIYMKESSLPFYEVDSVKKELLCECKIGK